MLRGNTFVYREINISKCHKIWKLLYFSKFCPFIPQTLNMSECCCAVWNTKWVLKLPFLNRGFNRQPQSQELYPTTSHFGSLQPHCFLYYRFAFPSVWLKPVFVQFLFSAMKPMSGTVWKWPLPELLFAKTFWKKRMGAGASLYYSEALLYAFAVANRSLNGAKVSS